MSEVAQRCVIITLRALSWLLALAALALLLPLEIGLHSFHLLWRVALVVAVPTHSMKGSTCLRCTR
jgi:hypothetical protein